MQAKISELLSCFFFFQVSLFLTRSWSRRDSRSFRTSTTCWCARRPRDVLAWSARSSCSSSCEMPSSRTRGSATVLASSPARTTAMICEASSVSRRSTRWKFLFVCLFLFICFCLFACLFVCVFFFLEAYLLHIFLIFAYILKPRSISVSFLVLSAGLGGWVGRSATSVPGCVWLR